VHCWHFLPFTRSEALFVNIVTRTRGATISLSITAEKLLPVLPAKGFAKNRGTFQRGKATSASALSSQKNQADAQLAI
jgi:hypothetical protein